MAIVLVTAKDIWLTRQKANPADLVDSEKLLIRVQSTLSIAACVTDDSFLKITLAAETLSDARFAGNAEWYTKDVATIFVGHSSDEADPSSQLESAETPGDEVISETTPTPRPRPRPRPDDLPDDLSDETVSESEPIPKPHAWNRTLIQMFEVITDTIVIVKRDRKA